ncbi:hypothetical protein ACH42_15995 [Endozoicomonas sp. (ex Bugula neritina AB1)]|nr:hypothetical protein ACH42_15995 [Endozoicomonas sp. (ex Bugula neritina AB1)]
MKPLFYYLLPMLVSCIVDSAIAVDANDYAARPSQGSTTSPPQVLLAMPVDYQLFDRAYADYTDLDGDGIIDSSYKDDFNYFGYFDSEWCYQYSSTNNYYSPISRATGTNSHFCQTSSAPWSGNFMNWVAMSRIDILRSILFGGKRIIDTSTKTVLRRAELSQILTGTWAKIYNGSDIRNYTPYTDATTFCSVRDNNEPVLRIATGLFPRWATTEITQCQWGRPLSPVISEERATHRVQVEVCVDGKDANSSTRCKQYPSGHYKPIGILQRYGEDNQIHFGLLSGNYENNRSGGVLRRNIQPFANNTNSANDEVNLSDGTFRTNLNGIVTHISNFRVARWDNPISEIYLEAIRYFSGDNSPTSQYNANDANWGHTTESWVNPLDSSNACASCVIILISSGSNTFDRDDLHHTASDITGFSGVNDLNNKTNELGNIEYGGSFAGSYYHGGSDGRCTPKYLSGLSGANGICPDAGKNNGGYAVAGLSFHALTTDLRIDLNGMQNVKTYAIQLGEALPSLTADVNGKFVSFQPLDSDLKGTFRDLVVEEQAADGSSGKYLFIWEDLPKGDVDYDASSRIEYCVGSACSPSVGPDQIQISDRFEGKASNTDTHAFSYSLFGTSSDGVITPYSVGPGGGRVQGPGDWRDKTYTAIGSNSAILPKPLFLAAKYGGFTDLDNDGTPNHDANNDGIPDNDSREWDFRNNTTGALGADGTPDNFFLANNPTLLESQLELILKDISSRISAGSSAALISNSSSGVGAAIQALFRPKITVNDIEISWVGLLHSLFVDSNGHLREDSNSNDRLDDYSVDKAVTLFFDTISSQTVVQRYSSTDNGKTLIAEGSTDDLTNLKPVWDAREQLMEVSNITSQRTYSDESDTGRHILTWLDSNDDNAVDATETLPFQTSTFSGSNNGYLGVTTGEVDKLVKYIRGEDQPGYRSRSVDYDNDGNLEVWRLGDIMHSSPVSVSEPKGFYSESKPFNSNDATFINFQNQYKNRRQMIYTGSNGGMIHGFNGGFWDENNSRYLLSNGSETTHPLGGEIWAYTPMNLLPHLRWLSEPDYPHVYYMDGEPLIFDANIFPSDATHPGGWGTVLVMGMRLGGGAIDASIGGTIKTMRSAYVIMDITDPEQPPTLLAEVTHPELGFTTTRPVVIQRRLPDTNGDFTTPSENNWYIGFGSGPIGTGTAGTRAALDNASSNQSMKVFIYDLKNKSFVANYAPADSGISSSYAGNMGVVDWDNDYYDDAIYFGSVQTSGSLAGQLMRINLEPPLASNWELSSLMNVGRPITSSPTTLSNSDNERWIFAGTGRELIQADSRSNTQEYFLGVKEPSTGGSFTYGSVAFNSLIDTTDVQVRANGALTSTFTVKPGAAVDNFNALLNAIESENGWVNRLERNSSDPTGKNTSSAAKIFSLLLFTEYVPPPNQCEIDGLSYLTVLHYQTGTAIPAGTQAVLTTGTITDTTISTKRINLGVGLAPSPVIHQGSDGKPSVIIQGGAGNISSTALDYSLIDEGRQSWRQIFNIPR